MNDSFEKKIRAAAVAVGAIFNTYAESDQPLAAFFICQYERR